jgi:uncharacterized protein YmfQ (DUF2313 family)
MPAPQYSAADFLARLLQLLPRGRAWPRDPDAVLPQALATLVPSFVRSAEAAVDLIAEALPSTTVQLLPEWQATLGLPDPCAGPVQSLQQARNQVVARFCDQGGQSQAYMIAYAGSLGYQIQIQQLAGARFGQTRFGQNFGGPDWNFAWRVLAPSVTQSKLQFGAGRFGQPWSSFGNAVLQCELQAIAPAHTILLFGFTLPG